MAPSPLPHLLHFEISHYNEKVRWALDHKRVPHTREALTPGLHIPRVRSLTGQHQVPVLVLDGQPLVGSARILDEIERRWPQPALFPARPPERARALALQRRFDDEVAPELRRLFWSTYWARSSELVRMITMARGGALPIALRAALPVLRVAFARNLGVTRAKVDAARAALPRSLDLVARELDGREYLVGDGFTAADLAVASVMTAILRPPEFPYPLPEPWPPELVELRDGVADHPASRWVFEVYRRHRGTSAEVT